VSHSKGKTDNSKRTTSIVPQPVLLIGASAGRDQSAKLVLLIRTLP
jgi:hypothetical protein